MDEWPRTVAIVAYFGYYVLMTRFVARFGTVAVIAHVTLLIYTVFTLTGYAFFPAVPSTGNVYFGNETFWPMFVFLSSSVMLSHLCMWATEGWLRMPSWDIGRLESRREPTMVFWFVALTSLLFNVVYGYVFRGEMAWGQNAAFGRSWFGFLFQFGVVLGLLAYAGARLLTRRRMILSLTAAAHLGSTAVIAGMGGQRSSLLYTAVAILAFELTIAVRRHRLRWQLALTTAVLLPLLLIVQGLQLARYSAEDVGLSSAVRYAVESDDAMSVLMGGPALENAIGQDYFWGASLFAVAYHYKAIDPGMVLRSNIGNLIPGGRFWASRQEPMIGEVLGRLVDSNTRRNAGFSFNLFVEGYTFAGYAGVVYNAFAVLLFLLLFFRSIRFTDQRVSLCASIVASYFTMNAMRGQTGGFAQTYLLDVVPGALLALQMNGIGLADVSWLRFGRDTEEMRRHKALQQTQLGDSGI